MATTRTLDIDALRSGFQGTVLRPGDHEYDEARKVWNAIFDRRPAVIARCSDEEDVARAIVFARDRGLVLSVKGGGHNSAGTGMCEGGAAIDLSPMRKVEVDPNRRTARVQGGALLGDVDRETQRHGLAVSSGIMSQTGVGGLTTGGGFGWISRKYGLTVDNLISARVATADGRVVTASAKENTDLFWGIRGGGGNFGVVTSFEFRCAPIGTQVYSGLIVKRFEDGKQFFRFYREYVRELPDEMTVWTVVRHAPPLPFLPQDVHGKMVIIVPCVWLGKPEEGAKLLQPVRDATPSHGEALGENPWLAWQSGFDALNLHGARNYWKSHDLEELSDLCIERFLHFAGDLPTQDCEALILHMEGAPARVPETETAYGYRKVPFVLNVHTRWTDPKDDARCTAWAKAFHDATREFARGVYVNFLSEEGSDRVKDAYTPETWRRLVELKKKWDSKNLFRMNQNIPPTG